MASTKQIAANRLNSQKSTGPSTRAGKQASRLNAVKSGLYADTLVIRGETASELDRLMAEYHAEFRPVTARERDLVDAMVRNEWIIRRMGLVEAELWSHHFQHTSATIPSSRFDVLERHFPLGQAFTALSVHFERLQRRVSALERSSRLSLQELTELRNQRDSAIDEDPEPLETEPTSAPIGFVPSLLAQAPMPARDPQVSLSTVAAPADHAAAAAPEPLPPSPAPHRPHNPLPIPSPVGNTNNPCQAILVI